MLTGVRRDDLADRVEREVEVEFPAVDADFDAARDGVVGEHRRRFMQRIGERAFERGVEGVAILDGAAEREFRVGIGDEFRGELADDLRHQLRGQRLRRRVGDGGVEPCFQLGFQFEQDIPRRLSDGALGALLQCLALALRGSELFFRLGFGIVDEVLRLGLSFGDDALTFRFGLFDPFVVYLLQQALKFVRHFLFLPYSRRSAERPDRVVRHNSPPLHNKPLNIQRNAMFSSMDFVKNGLAAENFAGYVIMKKASAAAARCVWRFGTREEVSVMIYDCLENLSRYSSAIPHAEQVIRFLAESFAKTPAPGKYELDGKALFVNVQEYATKAYDPDKLEYHQSYIDIQLLFDGEESIYFAPLDGLDVTMEFSAEKDCGMRRLPAPEQGTKLALRRGNFALFFPGEGHIPCVGDGRTVRKAVVKIAVK